MINRLHSVCSAGKSRELDRILSNIPKEQLKEKINVFNCFGFTPLHSAIYHDHYEIVDKLLKHGASATIPVNSEQWTFALHLAAPTGSTRLVRLLIINGGDPFLCDSDGCLPVQIAETAGNKQTASYLQQQMTVRKANTFGYPDWPSFKNNNDVDWWRHRAGQHSELDYFSDGGTPAPTHARLQQRRKTLHNDPNLVHSTSQPITLPELRKTNSRGSTIQMIASHSKAKA